MGVGMVNADDAAVKLRLASELLLCAVAMAATACGTADHAADKHDAGAAVDAATVDDGNETQDAASDSAQCNPECAPEQLCCTDLHGHFPTCTEGPECP
jgi:hypothetical protein